MGPGLWDELESVEAMVDDLVPVIRWDQRGAGRSDHAGPYEMARFLADLERIREALGIERWIVGGHSWGAGLALRYALAHPARTRALVCIAGTDLRWRVHREAYRAERLRRLGPHLARWSELRASATPEESRELLRLTSSTDFADRGNALDLAARWGYERFPINAEANAALNAAGDAEDDDDLRARCQTLLVDALVVHGAEDPRPVDGPRELAAALPRARLVVLPGVGHVPWAEHPALLRDALRSFLSQLPP